MIDWNRVTTLREEIGADGFDEVVELFLDEVDEVMARLRVAPDPTTLEEDLHFLKGSALGLGFRSFSKLCQIGENQSANGNAVQVDLQEILDNYIDSKQHFQAEIGRALEG
jgi:HPt (histidine-containing phosphotransfer) domain-containing protein